MSKSAGQRCCVVFSFRFGKERRRGLIFDTVLVPGSDKLLIAVGRPMRLQNMPWLDLNNTPKVIPTFMSPLLLFIEKSN